MSSEVTACPGSLCFPQDVFEAELASLEAQTAAVQQVRQLLAISNAASQLSANCDLQAAACMRSGRDGTPDLKFRVVGA
jgi:hypothetical protein